MMLARIARSVTALAVIAIALAAVPAPTYLSAARGDAHSTGATEALADLDVGQGNAADPPFGFGTVFFGFRVSNFGPDEAAEVAFRATLPQGATFNKLEPKFDPSQIDVRCTTPPVGEGGDIVCTIARLPADADPTAGVRFDVTLDVTAAPASHLVFESVVSAVSRDPDTANNAWVFDYVVPAPPVIASIRGVRRAGKLYRIEIKGTNFYPGCFPFGVLIGEEQYPWHDLRFKDDETVILRDSRAIRLLFPKNVPTTVAVVNCEGGYTLGRFTR